MYLKVCILHYFYFPYRCWYAIHYQTQMDFQNPISLLPFSIPLLTFYARLTSEHLGPLLHFDLNLSREIASLSRYREILLSPQLMTVSTVILVFSQLGHVLWRLSPILGVGVGLGDFLFSSKLMVMELTSVECGCFKTEWGEHPDDCLLGISPVVSLPQVACHRHLWSGASSSRCYGAKEFHQER